jgi:serine/threonine protein kinase
MPGSDKLECQCDGSCSCLDSPSARVRPQDSALTTDSNRGPIGASGTAGGPAPVPASKPVLSPPAKLPLAIDGKRYSYPQGGIGSGSFGVCYSVLNEKGEPRLFKEIERPEFAALRAEVSDAEQDASLFLSREGRALQAIGLGRECLIVNPSSGYIAPGYKQKLLPGQTFYNHLEQVAIVKPRYLPEKAHLELTPEHRLHQTLEMAFRLAAEQLVYFHGLGIQHFDVKPENVMVEQDDDGNIIAAHHVDFGLAGLKSDEAVMIPWVGTINYMCLSEQARKIQRRLDGHADVYGLAMMLGMQLAGITEHELDGRRKDKVCEKYNCNIAPADKRTWLLNTEADLPDLLKLPDDASKEAKALSRFLGRVIAAGESGGYSPREFLQGLLEIVEHEGHRFPQVEYAQVAKRLLAKDDETLGHEFTESNRRLKAISQFIKKAVLTRDDLDESARIAVSGILQTIRATDRIQRTIEQADALEKRLREQVDRILDDCFTKLSDSIDNIQVSDIIPASPDMASGDAASDIADSFEQIKRDIQRLSPDDKIPDKFNELSKRCSTLLQKALAQTVASVGDNPKVFFKRSTSADAVEKKIEMLENSIRMITNLQFQEDFGALHAFLDGLKRGANKGMVVNGVTEASDSTPTQHAMQMAKCIDTHRARFFFCRWGKTSTRKDLDHCLEQTLSPAHLAYYKAAPAA